MRFKQLVAQAAYDVRQIDYQYDALSRLIAADYADNSREYAYLYDVAGNRRQEQVTIGITTTTTNWTYNAANQIATQQIGGNPATNFSYDANGNLLNDGVLTYTYNRADRLITVNNGSFNTHYAYDGDHQRRTQTIGGVATQYLLDLQPELALVLRETTGADTLQYTHSPRGVHTVEDTSGDWHYMAQDGLGSVRAELDANTQFAASQEYAPYGLPFNTTGTFAGSFGYAGEQIGNTGLSYNRARYYNPALGTFTGLDPFEGIEEEPMSLNGYSYVHGNPIIFTDASGENPAAPFLVAGPWGWLILAAATILGIGIIAIVGNTCYLSGGCTISLDSILRQLGGGVDVPPYDPPYVPPANPPRDVPQDIPQDSPWTPQRAPEPEITPTPTPGKQPRLPRIPLPLPDLRGDTATPTPTKTPEKSIVMDVGPGDNIVEIVAILHYRQNHTLVAVDDNSNNTSDFPGDLLRYINDKPFATRWVNHKLGLNLTPDQLDFERLELIVGDFTNPGILNGRQADEIFAMYPYPNHDVGRKLSLASNHLKPGGQIYVVSEDITAIRDIYTEFRKNQILIDNSFSRHPNNPNGGLRSVAASEILAGKNCAGIPFWSGHSHNYVYDLCGKK